MVQLLTGLISTVLFLALHAEPSQDYSITPIHSSSGLYYEKIGQVSLSNNNWEFITYIDYSGYLIFYQYLHEQAQKLEEFCAVSKSKECADKYDQLKSKLNAIEETDIDMANYLGVKKPKRIKRFWGAIGSFFLSVGKGIVTSLFGGGRSREDLSAYNDMIRSLQQEQRDLQNQVNAQATVFMLDSERKNYQIQWLNETQKQIQGNIDALKTDFKMDSQAKAEQIAELNFMMNETRIKLQKNEEAQKKLESDVDKVQQKLLEVDKGMDSLSRKIKDNSKKIDEQYLTSKVISLAFDLHLLLDRFQYEQGKLYNAVVKAKQLKKGNLDPYVLTPLNLIEMLQGIELKENEMFPFRPSIENAHRLYNLIEPDVYLYNDKLIFVLKIPLVMHKRFSLFKMTSLPVPLRKQLFAFVLPQEAYLLIDVEEKEYALLPAEEFKGSCEQLGNVSYVCKQTQFVRPVYGSADCEVTLFTKTVIPATCNVRLMYLESPVILQLMKKNSWIYAAPQHNTQVSTICESVKYISSVRGSGFLSCKDKCGVRVDNIQLVSLIEYTKPVVSNYSSPAHIAENIDIPSDEGLKLAAKKQQQIILPYNLKQLEAMSVNINDIKKDYTYLYYLLLIPVVVLLAVLAFFVYKSNMSYKEYKEYISRKMSRSSNKENDGSSKDRLRMKVKLNKSDKISKVSIKEDHSEDPDAEYLTVRFKVEKDKIKKNIENNLNPQFQNPSAPPNKKQANTEKSGVVYSTLLLPDKQDCKFSKNVEINETVAQDDDDGGYVPMGKKQHNVNLRKPSTSDTKCHSQADDNDDEDIIYGNVPDEDLEKKRLEELRMLKPVWSDKYVDILRKVKPNKPDYNDK